MKIFLPRSSKNHRSAFTLVELLAVIAIIVILTALVLGTFKFVQEKGARSRADSEIKAMEAGLEGYKADNGAYPRTGTTDGLDPATTLTPTSYVASSKALYQALSGDGNDSLGGATASDGQLDAGSKQYMEFKSNQLAPTPATNGYYVVDPWGNSYGYSTINQATIASASPKGYNPTFDLWSTGGSTTDATKWLKNW